MKKETFSVREAEKACEKVLGKRYYSSLVEEGEVFYKIIRVAALKAFLKKIEGKESDIIRNAIIMLDRGIVPDD